MDRRVLSKLSVLLDDLVERASRIAADVLKSQTEQVDRDGVWPAAGIRALLDAGFGGLVVPIECGGLGHGLLAVARVCEVLARECPSTAISLGMHFVGSAVISAKATPEQRRRFLEPIARGEHLTTLALSEPGTGSNFYIPETTIERTAEGYSIQGTKAFVTNGGHADSYVVSVAPIEPGRVGEFSCVMVEEGAPGMKWGGEWNGWGMRGNSARTVELDGVKIPRQHLIGEEGDEIWYVFNVVTPYFLMAMAGTYLGLAARAIDEGRDHLISRRHTHNQTALSETPIVQHRMGELWAAVHRTRTLIYDAADKGEAGHPDALLALCSSKAEVADVAERVAAEVMTLMGGRGYAENQRIHRIYRDARAAHVMSPTTDLLRLWTGRALLGLPILAE